MRTFNIVTFCLFFLLSPVFSVSQETIKGTEDIISVPLLAWKFQTKFPVYASPVINGSSVYFGGNDSIFHSIDLVSGKENWKMKTMGSIRSTALVEKENIYFTNSEGALFCVTSSGQLVWRFDAGPETPYDFADYHQSSPILLKNNLYFGSGNGSVYSVDAITGLKNWEFKTGNVVHGSPAGDSNTLYVGSFDGYVYALNQPDGSLKWTFKTVGHAYFPKGEVQGSPVLFGKKVFIGARDYNFYAIQKEKGYCYWNNVYTKGWVLSASIHDSILYVAGADERILAAMDPVSGKVLWKKDMEFLVFGKPAFSKSMLYIGTTMGKLHGIRLSDGVTVWTFTTAGYQYSRSRYFKEDDSYRDDIYSIITSNEQFLQLEEELGGFFSTPAIKDGYIVIGSTDGNVYCLHP